MSKWKGPWECRIHGVLEYGLVDLDEEGKHIHAVGPYGLCRESLTPYDRRAPDPRVAALVEAGKALRDSCKYCERMGVHSGRECAEWDAALAALKEEA